MWRCSSEESRRLQYYSQLWQDNDSSFEIAHLVAANLVAGVAKAYQDANLNLLVKSYQSLSKQRHGVERKSLKQSQDKCVQ
jgi:hypothetical protein